MVTRKGMQGNRPANEMQLRLCFRCLGWMCEAPAASKRGGADPYRRLDVPEGPPESIGAICIFWNPPKLWLFRAGIRGSQFDSRNVLRAELPMRLVAGRELAQKDKATATMICQLPMDHLPG